MPTETTAPDLSAEEIEALQGADPGVIQSVLLVRGGASRDVLPSLLAMARRTLAAEAERDALKAENDAPCCTCLFRESPPVRRYLKSDPTCPVHGAAGQRQ